VLLRTKDQRAFVVAGLEQPFYQGNLLGFVDDIGPLDDLGGGLGDGDIDLRGVMQDLAGKVPDLRRHGCGEKEVLALGRQIGDDLHDIVEKAHIEHPVGFVEDEVLQARQLNITHIEVGDHPARSTDDDFGAARERLFFRREVAAVTATVNGNRADVCKIRKPLHILRDLDRQLPRGYDDKGINGIGVAGLDEFVDDGQEEGGGFAGPGLGGGDDILPF